MPHRSAGRARTARAGRVRWLATPILWVALASALTTALAPAAGADEVDPLDVALGDGTPPESLITLPAPERIEQASRDLRERGYAEQPILAWAMLEAAREARSEQLARRAVELAPETPAVHFEAVRQGAGIGYALSGVLSVWQNLPALAWACTVFLGALAGAFAVAGALLAGFAFARAVDLHGHAMAHRFTEQDPPTWPGVLLLLGVLAYLPLSGLGLAPVLAVAGALGVMRGPRGLAIATALVMMVVGALAGPGIDAWARIASAGAQAPELAAAWRVDRAQPLPGDAELLERAVERDPDDVFYRLALATYLKRRGELDAAGRAIEEVADGASRNLRAAVFNLRGILRLAVGDVQGALDGFERARSVVESAPVLYNLSQVYARTVSLIERQSLYELALGLDPVLVSSFAERSSANVHDYLIQPPLERGEFFARAWRPSAASEGVSGRLRAAVLGPSAPPFTWALLPVLAGVALALRRGNLLRCKRCDRVLCVACVPGAKANGTCMRCERLFAARSKTDSRVRKQQAEIDRLRQIRMRRNRALLGIVVPGLLPLFEGRVFAGVRRLLLLGFAVALAGVAARVPVPFEAGPFAIEGPLAIATCVAGYLAVVSVLDAAAVFSGKKRR